MYGINLQMNRLDASYFSITCMQRFKVNDSFISKIYPDLEIFFNILISEYKIM